MTGELRSSLMELAGEVRPVDLRDRVLKGSRRMAIRQRVIGGATAAVAVVGLVGALILVRPSGEVTPPIGSPTPAPTSAPASPSPTASPSPDPASKVNIRNATFPLPKLSDCPAGTRTFVDGVAEADAKAEPNASSWRQGPKTTLADVDGVPGPEILLPITCYSYTSADQVLALKVSADGELSSLGFVAKSQDHPSFEIDQDEPIVVRDGVVEVTVLSPGVPDGGHGILELQVRGYRFVNGSFRQVSGPTKFAPLPSDPANIVVPNATVEVMTTKGRDFVKFVNGSGQARIDGIVYSVTVVKWQFLADPTIAVVLYRFKDPNGVTTESLVIYTFSLVRALADESSVALESGQDSVAHVQTFETMQGRQMKVTVELAGGGTEVRTYRENTGTLRWERVN